MKETKANIVWSGKATLGEGPFWDELEQKLYWVDIDGFKLHTYDPATEENTTLPFAQHVTAVVKKESGGLLLAMRDGLYTYYRDRLTPYFLHPDGGRVIRFNDAKCDPNGRLWAGTMAFDGKSNIGSLYVLDHDENTTEVLTGLTISNGMAWDTARELFYHTETNSKTTAVYRYEPESTELQKLGTVPIDYKKHGGSPDGMTIDNEGNLWVALWGGSAVIKVNPNNGDVLERIEVEAPNTTSCTFGGSDYKTLFITTASSEGEPNSGALFSVTTEVAGVKSQSYRSNKSI